MESSDSYIRRALRLVRELMLLADEGDLNRHDDGCGVLYGVIRDCAYTIRAEAEREREEHLRRGEWNEEEPRRTDETPGSGPPAAHSTGSPRRRRNPNRSATPSKTSLL